jgi:crotonobetaine/carnitine-CoA ligase
VTPGSGTPSLPLHDRGRDTVASVLEGHAARRPDAPFLLFERQPGEIEQLSWAEMDRRAEATAIRLAELGVSAGETFNVHLQNCPEFFQLWFAAAKLGAAVVPTNPLASPGELGYQLADSGCRLSVTQPDLVETVQQARAQAPDCAQVLVAGQRWPRGEQPGTRESPGPTDVLGILYTSGTTSRPKGVMVTHAAYLHVGDAVAGHLRLRPDDRQLVVLPLFHGNAQYYSTCSALVTGASIALAPGFSASRWSTQAARMGATVASLFAAPIRMILAAAQAPEDRQHALRAVMFAQNVTDEQLEAFETRFGAPLIQLYGMTETVVPVTMNPLYEHRRGASIGRPLPSAQLRIADTNDADVATGTAGQLLVGGIPGRTMMTGYLNKPEATTAALAGGWLHTGDTVTADEDGYFYFVDRAKDMIKRAGENIASAEVESVLNDHPAIYEAAVIGIPDQMRDEAIHAFVARHDGAQVSAEELRDWCSTRLSRFKVPDAFEFLETLPRTSVGKIQKHQLRPQPLDEADETDDPQSS